MGAVLAAAAGRLEAPHGRRDAEYLLARALGLSRAGLVTDRQRSVDQAQFAGFQRDVARLAIGEPLAYVLGTAPFLDFDLEVGPAVLIPRPETELLAEWAIARARLRGHRRAVDVGTGSGALAIALARATVDLTVDATDVFPEALAVARRNALRLDVGSRVRLHLADLIPRGGLRNTALIVANLPYVAEADSAQVQASVRRFEPPGALFAGTDGLSSIRRLVRRLPAAAAPDADLGLEIAPDQAGEVLAMVRRAYPRHALSVKRDLAGRDRFVLAAASAR